MGRVRSMIRAWGWKGTIAFLLLMLCVSMLLVVGGAAGLAWTNTENFCISCHEMRDNVYAEFKGTIHDYNRSGVRAVCSDCHVPREPVALVRRKFAASWELWHAFRGTVDTPEKFEAHRYELALRVWQRMKDTDSLECRNCHHREAMNPELQTARAQKRHARAEAEGQTCIDCHFGIAHQEPEGPLGPQDLVPGGTPPAVDAIQKDAEVAPATETAPP